MKLLRKGITGFDGEKRVSGHSIHDVKEFISIIHFPFTKLNDIESPNESSNYFRAGIVNQKEKTRFDLLIHFSQWYIACIKTESTWMDLEFTDIPEELELQLTSFHHEITILKKEILDSEISKEELKVLGKSELHEINYWNSKNYGEIIFNGYD